MHFGLLRKVLTDKVLNDMLRCLILLLLIAPVAYAQNSNSVATINTFLDQWHQAASSANADIFFGSIADDGIYIGTADHERWTKSEFITFAKPFFDRGKAWDFKSYERNVHVTSDGQIAWFSELLTTWMGVCRGSGILHKTATGWKIDQYHLSVTVPNEIIKDFITLVKNSKNTDVKK
ncbi:MAG TPA: nuclear transport factor 2 family protein [Chryseolinea sp.]|nr:nuclear transport factor 2 family protein [Chryseolinea sp.]